VTADATQPTPIALSDDASAVLYPDVESAPPQQLPADAERTPAPFAQRESPLLDIVRMYQSGQVDWPTTRQALIDFDYAPVEVPGGEPVGATAGQWYGDIEDAAYDEPVGSWAELQSAADVGMLTRDEFNEVLAARAGSTDSPSEPEPGSAVGPDQLDQAQAATG
jgi:hypothetical protein